MQINKLMMPARIVTAVLAVVAISAAVYFGYGWGHALFVEKPTATTRDDALAGAREAAINLSSYDAANLDKSFADIESSITGDAMQNDLNATKSQITDQLRQTKAKTDAAVLDATLTEFNKDDGTGKALVVLASTTTWPNQPVRKVKVTVRITVEDVDGIWKAAKMENVGTPVAMDSGTLPGAAPTPAPNAPSTIPEQNVPAPGP